MWHPSRVELVIVAPHSLHNPQKKLIRLPKTPPEKWRSEQWIDPIKIVMCELLMEGFSIVGPLHAASLDRGPVVLYMVPLIMDDEDHDHQGLGIITRLIRRCVDDIVVEKLVRTIHHDIQIGIRHHDERAPYVCAANKTRTGRQENYLSGQRGT